MHSNSTRSYKTLGHCKNPSSQTRFRPAESRLKEVVSINAHAVQPGTSTSGGGGPGASLRTKVKEALPWKSSTQHVIDQLKPENVEEFRGRLNFSISFNADSEMLYVHVLEAIDLPVRDLMGEH